MCDELLKNTLPCPFCGWHELRITDWWDDDGEYNAIECRKCKGCAPADIWNKRPNKTQAVKTHNQGV